MLICLLNHSTRVTELEARRIARAVNEQLRREVAPAWSMRAPHFYFASDETKVIEGSSILRLVDETPEADDALGYHTEETSGLFDGPIACKTIPGDVLLGADSVSTVVSHEAIELFVDPRVNVWVDAPDGWSYPQEACDAVQGDWYWIQNVSVSSFLYPSYFDPYSRGPFDKLSRLSAPFSLAPNGYTVRRRCGKGETEIFGARPEWKPRALRSSRRAVRL